MATTLEELVVKLGADVSGLQKGMADGLQSVADSTSKMEQATSQFAENSSKHLFSFSAAAETALGVFEGEALLEGIKKLGELIGDVFKEITVESVDAASKQEDAITRLNVALGSAGQYTRETSDDFTEFAHAIQGSTKYSEESVIQAGALIETFGKLDKDGLQRATTAAINLAAATGKDLNTAALLVGKAAEGNVTQFARWGIEVETGSTKAETFANALKAIEAMGNVAQGQAQTYSGAIAELSHAWEDAQKQIGFAVVGNQAVIEVLKELATIMAQVGDFLKENNQEIKEWVAQGLIIAIETVRELTEDLNDLMRGGMATFEALMVPIKVLVSGIVAAQQAISGDFKGAWEQLKISAVEAADDIGKAYTEKTKLGDLDVMLNQVEASAIKGFAAVKNGADSTVAPINQAKKAVSELTAEEIALGDAGVKLFDAQQKSDPAIKYQLDLAALKAADAQKRITDTQYSAAVKKLDKDMADQKQTDRETEITNLQKQDHDMQLIDANGNADRIAANKAKIAQLMSQEDAYSTFSLNEKKRQKEDDDKITKLRVDAAKTALGDLATFQNSKNSELAAVGKASAIAQTTISTYEGATKAYAALAGIPVVGPALGVAAAAAAIAAGIGNVAAIEGTPLASGIDSVPGIGSSDNFPAILAPGERVTDANTNQDLKGFLAGNASMTSVLTSIHKTLQGIASSGQQPTSIQIDGKTLITALRDQMRMGRTAFS